MVVLVVQQGRVTEGSQVCETEGGQWTQWVSHFELLIILVDLD